VGEEEPVTPVVPAHAALNLRRAVVIAAVAGVVAIAVLSAIGHPLAGLFVVVGLAGGGLNIRALQRSVARFATGEHGGKRMFIGNVFVRLGVFTLFALLIAFLVQPDGLGVVGGLALFHVLIVGTASVPVFKELRGT
jgi:hypothetical protein